MSGGRFGVGCSRCRHRERPDDDHAGDLHSRESGVEPSFPARAAADIRLCAVESPTYLAGRRDDSVTPVTPVTAVTPVTPHVPGRPRR